MGSLTEMNLANLREGLAEGRDNLTRLFTEFRAKVEAHPEQYHTMQEEHVAHSYAGQPAHPVSRETLNRILADVLHKKDIALAAIEPREMELAMDGPAVPMTPRVKEPGSHTV
jgi:hypothetical protein